MQVNSISLLKYPPWLSASHTPSFIACCMKGTTSNESWGRGRLRIRPLHRIQDQVRAYLVIFVPFPRYFLTVSECVSCTLHSLRQLEPGIWGGGGTQPGMLVSSLASPHPQFWSLTVFLNTETDHKLEVGRLRTEGAGTDSLRDSTTACTCCHAQARPNQPQHGSLSVSNPALGFIWSGL